MSFNIPQVMLYSLAVMLTQIGAQGHLSARETTVNAYICSHISSISLLDDTVAEMLIKCYCGWLIAQANNKNTQLFCISALRGNSAEMLVIDTVEAL